MTAFTQKWAIIIPLEPVEEGAEFPRTEFPLHVTLAGVFATDDSGEVLAGKLETLLAGVRPFQMRADDEAWFGPDQNIHVMKMRPSTELIELYHKVYDFLRESDAVYNEPQYEGDGYVPHSTYQGHAALTQDSEVMAASVALIDLFPGGDGLRRRITRVIPL